MKPDDQAILVTHQPMWLAEWFKERAGCHNLRQLVRCHLKGRARIHLAGAYPQSQRPVSFNLPTRQQGLAAVHQEGPVYRSDPTHREA